MNRLILIGNGFDLAHGLKTSYSDFILWYFGEVFKNNIFEHINCNRIKIFYYQKDEKSNDYFEKTQEISRHFKAENKGIMRNRIVPLLDSKPLTNIK